MYEIKNFKEMTKAQLKSECNKRGLPTKDTKISLMLSLYNHDLASMKQSFDESIANFDPEVDITLSYAELDAESAAVLEKKEKEIEEYFEAKRAAHQQMEDVGGEWVAEYRRVTLRVTI